MKESGYLFNIWYSTGMYKYPAETNIKEHFEEKMCTSFQAGNMVFPGYVSLLHTYK